MCSGWNMAGDDGRNVSRLLHSLQRGLLTTSRGLIGPGSYQPALAMQHCARSVSTPAALTPQGRAKSVSEREILEAPLLAQLLADTQAELVRTAAAAAMRQARAEHLAQQLEQAQLALPEPTSHLRPQTSDSEGLTVEPTQTSSDPPRARPWWRRLLPA